MPFQPAVDEPSKAWPELNLSSSKCEKGTVTCLTLHRLGRRHSSRLLCSLWMGAARVFHYGVPHNVDSQVGRNPIPLRPAGGRWVA
jgi:hypothetical protein